MELIAGRLVLLGMSLLIVFMVCLVCNQSENVCQKVRSHHNLPHMPKSTLFFSFVIKHFPDIPIHCNPLARVNMGDVG